VVGMMIIKTFVMTTLDTASRLGRFVGTELFGSNGLGITVMDNRYVSTIVLIIPAGALALTDSRTSTEHAPFDCKAQFIIKPLCTHEYERSMVECGEVTYT